MLGETILDSEGLDGLLGESSGLGLIPASTVMRAEKTTRVRSARTPAGSTFEAYEIHMGDTHLQHSMPPFAILEDGSHDGVRSERILGTYLHGALESPQVIKEIFGFSSPQAELRIDNLDSLAQWLEANSDPAVLSQLIYS